MSVDWVSESRQSRDIVTRLFIDCFQSVWVDLTCAASIYCTWMRRRNCRLAEPKVAGLHTLVICIGSCEQARPLCHICCGASVVGQARLLFMHRGTPRCACCCPLWGGILHYTHRPAVVECILRADVQSLRPSYTRMCRGSPTPVYMAASVHGMIKRCSEPNSIGIVDVHGCASLPYRLVWLLVAQRCLASG
jgi:hypothetical protein